MEGKYLPCHMCSINILVPPPSLLDNENITSVVRANVRVEILKEKKTGKFRILSWTLSAYKRDTRSSLEACEAKKDYEVKNNTWVSRRTSLRKNNVVNN